MRLIERDINFIRRCMNSSKSGNIVRNSAKELTVTTVGRKNSSTVTNQVAVTSRRTSPTAAIKVITPLVERGIKNDVSDKYTYAPQVLRGSPSGVVTCAFKNKSSEEIN